MKIYAFQETRKPNRDSGDCFFPDEKALPPGGRALRQQNSPETGNNTFSGTSFLPVNPEAVIPALGYDCPISCRARQVTESFRIRKFICLYNNWGISKSSRMEGIRNTWARLRIRLKFPGAWRIGWSSARGLVLFAFYTYSREKYRFVSLEIR